MKVLLETKPIALHITPRSTLTQLVFVFIDAITYYLLGFFLNGAEFAEFSEFRESTEA